MFYGYQTNICTKLEEKTGTSPQTQSRPTGTSLKINLFRLWNDLVPIAMILHSACTF